MQSASSTELVVESGLRFPYTNPDVSLVDASTARYHGDIGATAQSIPVPCGSRFALGDLIRIENTTGTDSPGGSSAYFEIGKVECSSSALKQGQHFILHLETLGLRRWTRLAT